MPKVEQQNFEFKSVQPRGFAPIVGFFDLESIIEPVANDYNTQQNSVTRALEEYKPCCYALLFVALNEAKPFYFDLKCCPNVKVEFVN